MRTLLFADIHIGSIKEISYVYNTLTDIIDKEILFTKTDLVVILGDYFHRLFKVNEEYVTLAINVMSYLIRTCKKSNTKIRIIYGTESHEMNQYHLFNYHVTSTGIDMKIFDTVTEEVINGKKILYLPEEYIDDKHEFYKDYLYSGKEYDYIFGHGIIVEGMPAAVAYSENKTGEKQVPRFKSGELSNVGKLTVFGHYHCHVDLDGNVHYLGSLFRDSFGEETPKGYGIIEDDKFTFIENKAAYVYKTYVFDETSDIYESSDNILRAIDKIKAENPEIFNGDNIGKIRIVFNTPPDVDPVFRENLRDILFNNKIIFPMIKESSSDMIEEIKENTDGEYDFILDNSLYIVDKIHRYISKTYDDPMSLSTLKKYIEKYI